MISMKHLIAIISSTILTSCAVAQSLHSDEYESLNDVKRKVIIPAPDIRSSKVSPWLAFSTARSGGRSSTISAYALIKRNLFGYVCEINWTHYQCNTVGTVLAFPCGDFEVVKTYDYFDKASKMMMKAVHATVDVVVSYPSATKMPSPPAVDRTVKNLVENGMQVPQSVGPRGRLMSLMSAAKIRFCSKRCYASYHDAENGKVHLLLEACDLRKENCDVHPATYVSSVSKTLKGMTLDDVKRKKNDGYTAEELNALK